MIVKMKNGDVRWIYSYGAKFARDGTKSIVNVHTISKGQSAKRAKNKDIKLTPKEHKFEDIDYIVSLGDILPTAKQEADSRREAWYLTLEMCLLCSRISNATEQEISEKIYPFVVKYKELEESIGNTFDLESAVASAHKLKSGIKCFAFSDNELAAWPTIKKTTKRNTKGKKE